MKYLNITIDTSAPAFDDRLSEELQAVLNAPMIVNRLCGEEGAYIPLFDCDGQLCGCAQASEQPHTLITNDGEGKVLAKFEQGDYPVTWFAHYRGSRITHTITYGKQIKIFENDGEAGDEFGSCVRHSLECIGAFSEGPR